MRRPQNPIKTIQAAILIIALIEALIEPFQGTLKSPEADCGGRSPSKHCPRRIAVSVDFMARLKFKAKHMARNLRSYYGIYLKLS